MHFFGSLERIILDGGVTTNIPSRPDLERTDFEKTRVWNTFARVDHQLNSNNTWGVRWLRETSPQPLQINAENHTPSRFEAETDVDWTVVGNLSSIFGSNKVNTFRVSAVKEDVFFGNPLFNEGKNQKILKPTLNFLSFSDQQSPRANRRLDTAYGADNIFAWFLPNRLGGDHDVKVGLSYLYSSLRTQDFGNMNGTFTFATDLPFNAANPRTYPERLSLRVGNPLDFLMKGHFIGGFVQDKWRPPPRVTVSVGLRYDLELVRTPNARNPLFGGQGSSDYPVDGNNIAPRVGFTYALDDQSRSVVRGGFGTFFQKTSYTFLTAMFSAGRLSDSFTVNYPTNNAHPGPRAGALPTQPELVNGPVVTQAVFDQRFPAGVQNRNVGTVRFDNPDRQNAWSRQASLGYERQVGASLGVGIDFIRSEQRAQNVLKEFNPGLRDTTLATSTLRRTNPLVGATGEFAARVETLTNDGWINYNTVQVALTQRQRGGFSGRASYLVLPRARQRQHRPGGRGHVAGARQPQPRHRHRTLERRPAAHRVTGAVWSSVPKTRGLLGQRGLPGSLGHAVFSHRHARTTSTATARRSTSTCRRAPTRAPGTGRPSRWTTRAVATAARGPGYASLDMRAGYAWSGLPRRTNG